METRKKILIVEPDTGFTRGLLGLFADEGYDIEICRKFSQAIERIKDIKFDCLIMNVNLEEIKGYEAVPVIRTIDPQLPVIMTTEQNTKELEAKVREQNVYYYYIHSFDRNELRLAVRGLSGKATDTMPAADTDRRAKILVVDDDPDFVAGIRPVLESRGYEVDSACNKNEAMEKIQGDRPDLILLDIMMERVTDGFTICYRLKHDSDLKRIPVIAISAISEETGFRFSPRTDGEYFEADDYMEKPVKAADLLGRVQRFLGA